MVVYPKQIECHLKAELPFMATEKLLMMAVEKGGSRQEMHEIIKEHSVAVGKEIKENGRENDLFMRLAEDPRFPFTMEELEEILNDFPSFTGRASAQTLEFLAEVVEPLLEANRHSFIKADATISV